MSKKKTLAILGVISIVSLILIYGTSRSYNKEEKPVETLPGSQEYVIRQVTQKDGKTDEYFKPEAGTRILLDCGKDVYEITDLIEEWSFGWPIISLKDFSELTGIEAYEGVPRIKKGESRVRVEYFPEDEELKDRKSFYFSDKDGDYVKYSTLSRSAVASSSEISSSFIPIYNEKENTLYVSLDQLPYVDNENNIRLNNGVVPTYRENEILFEIN